ncbi:MAG: type II toxin-antitoxin system VapB family antitoxin [Opitutales bacterium]|nr:type II toxin-antitoxin system VapB family antitoxin [Opitutales bacterium]NRA27236.1 type II toxin-antitoxin system VapB family antitoxin [Opitutales bacterium]
MATNLKIDTELLDEALVLGGFETKKDTVNAALKSFVHYKKQLKVLELADSFEEFDDFDYKSYRKSS